VRLKPDARADKPEVVILDRDGTIVIDRNYLDDPAALEFLPGAAAGLRRMYERGHRLVVITNQSGIGRGFFSEARLQEIHARFAEMVQAAGARIERIYYCPHAPDSGCECRKPGTALLLQAATELGFIPRESVVIGDKASDVELGRAVGARTILIRGDEPLPASGADWVVDNLMEAAAMLAGTAAVES
jgi:D-glycero-D-manno-heptose 1,7-bisphosphate phosphatase